MVKHNSDHQVKYFYMFEAIFESFSRYIPEDHVIFIDLPARKQYEKC